MKLLLRFAVGSILWSFCGSGWAQIVPDSTLGVERSIITPEAFKDRIEGGAVRGANLFHSFREFNVGELQRVYFTNPIGVSNILTRVTGSNPSSIRGLLGVDGGANLFLINPNGIVFGPNSKLDLRGNFLASTANRVLFADGTEFSSTVAPQALLTNAVPIGLGLGSNPAPIEITGTGHQLNVPTTLSFVLGAGMSPVGLRVDPGQSLTLAGGNIELDGGVLTAPGGQINLISQARGVIGFAAGDFNSSAGANITLRNNALVDVSGTTAGSVQVSGKAVTLLDGSYILNQNQGPFPAGNITVHSDSLQFIGSSTDSRSRSNFSEVRSAIASETFVGQGADIQISTRTLDIQRSGGIVATTYGQGTGGRLAIVVADNARIDAGNLVTSDSPSTLLSETFGAGRGGDVFVSAYNLAVLNGGVLTAGTVANGQGGDVFVKVSGSIFVGGLANGALKISLLNAGSVGVGSGGNLQLEAKNLTVADLAFVGTATVASGASGTSLVTADSILLQNGGRLTANAFVPAPPQLEITGGGTFPTGRSGILVVNANTITIDNALLDVQNDGLSNAGSAFVTATRLKLLNQGRITAATTTGQGGNINLNVRVIELRDNSSITATAGGLGNGGSIFINAEALAMLENSSITANAFRGSGGRILITSQAAFWSATSTITATSELGTQLNGVVQLNVPVQSLMPPTSTEIPTQPPVLTSVCAPEQTREGKVSSFVMQGTSGLPINANSSLDASGWMPPKVPKLSIDKQQPQKNVVPLEEAQGWIENPDGTVRFVAREGLPRPPAPTACTSTRLRT